MAGRICGLRACLGECPGLSTCDRVAGGDAEGGPAAVTRRMCLASHSDLPATLRRLQCVCYGRGVCVCVNSDCWLKSCLLFTFRA